MKFHFTKMHGCGNDFVILDAREIDPLNWPEVAEKVLNRRTGVGGDQLLVLFPSTAGDVKMRIFERDGRESEMCGNGLRCVAAYLYEREQKAKMQLETMAGLNSAQVDSTQSVQVGMGRPIFDPASIPADLSWGQEIQILDRKVQVYPISMGNPHVVVFVDKSDQLEKIGVIGPKLEKHAAFPKGTNVELVLVSGPTTVQVRVWERGAGETLACGSGASAAAVASLYNGQVDSPVTVQFRGGEVEVRWRKDEEVYLTGPTTHVFDGEMTI